jgi:glyoxylase-like metal-dependent hydrolase (beta-lactamase superfamily II)
MNKVDDALNLWVFGPGFGEFVVVHVPPDGWLAIDGCVANKESWPQRFFEDLDFIPTHVLLTHPHQDHAAGIVELIDDATGDELSTWPRLGVLEPYVATPAVPDVELGFHGQDANGVLTAMRTRWTRRPACKWSLTVGSREQIGTGKALVLSPEPGPGSRDPNERATALELVWQNTRLVIGADLVETPGHGWSRALHRRPQARQYHALKVPHHGSPAALHVPLLQRQEGEDEAAYVLTPYSKGHKLPDFGETGGIATLLRHSGEVLMTGLPEKYALQSRRPRQWTRAELETAKRPIAAAEPVGEFPSCYVQLAFDAQGKLLQRHCAGVCVTR